ncbi:hypothetical protein WAI453_012712 [Rhynchosporium graminicola]
MGYILTDTGMRLKGHEAPRHSQAHTPTGDAPLRLVLPRVARPVLLPEQPLGQTTADEASMSKEPRSSIIINYKRGSIELKSGEYRTY